jgi:sugar phosphate permease
MGIAFLCIGVGITGVNATGYAVNLLDIAPRFAGVIMGITNVFGSLPGFLSPQIVGIITVNKVRWLTGFNLISQSRL